MSIFNICAFIYSFIGAVFVAYYWNNYYNKEYKEIKENDDAEDSMACIFMLCLWMFWPLFLFKEIFIKIKKLSV